MRQTLVQSKGRGLPTIILFGIVAGVLPAFVKPLLALGAVGGFAMVFFILRDPRLGMLLIAATIPLEVAGQVGQFTANLPLTIPKLLTLLTLGAWFVHLTLGRLRYRRMPWMYLLPLFWVVCLLSLAGGTEQRAGYEALLRLLTTILFFMLTVQLVDSPAMLKRVLTVFLICGALASSYAIVQRYYPQSLYSWRSGWEDQSARRFGVEEDIVEEAMVGVVDRSSGLSTHSILLALNISLMLAPLFAFLRQTTRREVFKRLFWAMLLGVFLAAIVVTYSRTGVLLILFCFGLIWWRKLLPLSAGVLGLVFLSGLAVLLFAPKQYFERVLEAQSYSLKSRSIKFRVEAQEAVLRQFQDHPILGVGYGNRYGIFDYLTNYPDKKHAVTPHQAYLQMAGQTGLLGLLVLGLFFWKAYRHTRGAVVRFRELDHQDMVHLGNALSISMLSFLFCGLALDLFDKGLAHAWLIIGLCAAYQLMAADESPGQEIDVPWQKTMSVGQNEGAGLKYPENA